MRSLKLFVLPLFLGGWFISSDDLRASSVDPAGIAGTYSDIRYIEEAGDVYGIEIEISYSEGKYKGAVQFAEGVPGTPIPVATQVSGKRIRFLIPEPNLFASRFQGEIRSGVLKGKFSFVNGAVRKVSLPKQPEKKEQ